MADIDPKIVPAAPSVTTGPIRGSRKIFVEKNGLRIAMRAVDLEPSSGEAPVTLYDTSGPYTDANVRIDIAQGLDGEAVVLALFDLGSEEIAASAHAVRAISG